MQVGASFAKQLFDITTPSGMVWIRLTLSALVLVAIARPRLRGRDRRDLGVVLGFGLCLAIMNWAFYESFARLPLGVAVTIEFLGPLGVALATSRRRVDLVWVGLAALGVVLLGFQRDEVNLPGVLLALLAGAAWAAYILLSQATGRRWSGVSGLSVASVVGAMLLAIPALLSAGTTLLDPRVLLVGAVVAMLSSVIPYSFELAALRILPTRVFGILMSLEPAAASLIALVVLGELLAPTQWVAVGCVVLASVGVTRTARAPAIHD